MAVRYVSDASFHWTRQKHGTGFRYFDTKTGEALPPEQIDRIKKLMIPPAWTDVKIGSNENGHIQAVGFDARKRKQYIYHPDWIQQNQQHKFDKMVRFGEVLPNLRETTAGHMRQHELTRERVLATMVWMLEHTFMRVGNKTYARDNNSYGLTTLRMKHVSVDGNTVNLSFKGKSGVYHDFDIKDRKIVRTIRKCLELPGYELFQYLDDNDERQVVDSQDVNSYLQQITGEDLSAKDFRTWGGTTLAGDTLYKIGASTNEADLKQALVQTVKAVSSELHNTVVVCRKYYIHPLIFKSYEQDKLIPHFAKIYGKSVDDIDGLSTEEYAAWTLLQNHKK